MSTIGALVDLFEFFDKEHKPGPSRDDDTFRVMVTGHRPSRLGGYRAPNPIQTWVRNHLHVFLKKLQARHGERLQAVSGMALGADQWFTEEALALGVPVLAALPFEGQESKWPGFSQERYHALLERCAEVHFVSYGEYSGGKMIGRNQWMVDVADLAAIVWDENYEGGGGTLDCVARILIADLPSMLFNPFRKYMGPLPPF